MQSRESAYLPPAGRGCCWLRKAGRSSVAKTCPSRVKGSAPPIRARGFANEAALAASVQNVDAWPWVRKYSLPAADTETTTPRSGARWRTMKPRSFASSHTGSRGHEVRNASSTSAYARGLGPIHSRRSRIRLSTMSATEPYEHRSRERVLSLVGHESSPIGRHSDRDTLRLGQGEVFVSEVAGQGIIARKAAMPALPVASHALRTPFRAQRSCPRSREGRRPRRSAGPADGQAAGPACG